MFPSLTQAQPGRYLLAVHAKPGARTSAFAAPLTPDAEEAELRIAAPPVEGQANAELVRFLDELVERGLRAMRADEAGYVQGTSCASVSAADAAACAASSGALGGRSGAGPAASDQRSGRRGRGKETSTAGGGGGVAQPKGGRAYGAASAAASAPLPDRVDVSLVRGGTSRTKTVLVAFPGTRAQLVAVLERESREGS